MTQPKAFELSRESGVLLAFQKRWLEDRSQVKIAEKSRQIGFTWTEAADDVLTAGSEDGMDCWYVGYNKDMAEKFIHDCANWAETFNLAAGDVEEFLFQDDDENKSIQTYRIRFDSGHRITALSSRPSSLRGKRGRVTLDEAAFMEDLPGMVKAAMALLMWGGEVRIVSTHNGDESHFNEIIKQVRAGKLPYSLHRIAFDDAIQEGLYRRVCLKLGDEWSEDGEKAWRDQIVAMYGDDAEEELFVVPKSSAGNYFPSALIESCMDAEIPVLRYQRKPGFAQWSDEARRQDCEDWCEEHLLPLLDALPKGYRCWLGEDFGRTSNLTVIAPAQESERLVYRMPFVVELANVPFKQQEQVLFFIADRLPRFMGGALDARGNGQYLAEVAMQRYGESRIEQVMASDSFYRDAFPKYKAAYEDREILVPRHNEFLADHRAVQQVKGVPKIPDTYKPKAIDGVQRHGDAAIAGLMLWYAVKNLNAGEIEFRAVDEGLDALTYFGNF